MPDKAKNNTAEGFVGSVAKYSISTIINMLIMGLSVILVGSIDKEINSQAGLFIDWTSTIMAFAILGLDQALIRFFYDPPKGLDKNGLFRLCFYFSSFVLLGAGVVCSTILQLPLYRYLGFSMVGPYVIPLLFLNAFFYMLARYYSVLYRMEMNIRLYSVITVLTQFFYKLFYILGYYLRPANPVPLMVLCSVAGLGGFTLVFSVLRRGMLRPRAAEFKSGAYRQLVPYGAAMAPTQLFLTFNAAVTKTIIVNSLGDYSNGVYTMAYTLSNMVTMIQLGFSAFWSAYMFENYKTQQARIKRVHDYLNFIMLVFFCCLVAFQDIIFWILPGYADTREILPLMMLAAALPILCETTAYGNAIAKKPIWDTLGWALSMALNLGVLILTLRPFGLHGAAIALAAANLGMYLLRSISGQRFYRSIPSVGKTAVALLVAIGVAAAGSALAFRFVPKGLVCLGAIGVYCLLYRGELGGLWRLGTGILKSVLQRKST